MPETPQLKEQEILKKLEDANYFGLKSNLDRTQVVQRIAREFGESPNWVKNVAVNNYGKDGRKIADDKILELLGLHDSGLEISVQKTSEDPPEGFVDIEDRERVYFISSAPNYVGMGAWKAITQQHDPDVGVGVVIINNGNNGPLSDDDFNRHAQLLLREGIYCASVYRDGISHPIDKEWSPKKKGTPYSVEDAMKDLFMPQQFFESIVTGLKTKQNVILQGPPGVGKTFIAKRIAKCLIGVDDSSRIELVQFHPSYSYEDFIQGWRPDGNGGFKLQEGPFYDFCERARGAEGDFVFVIDEINRGDLGKVFGELLMLIEGDKRGEDFAVRLTYLSKGDDRFFVPKNVYLIGLMNTADRSLAVVDYALRRRFSFFDIKPQFDSPCFKQKLVSLGVHESVADKIVVRIPALNKRISKDYANLGPGFEIGHSFFCPPAPGNFGDSWYQSIVELEIEPLLREYWFDAPKTVQKNLKLLLNGGEE